MNTSIANEAPRDGFRIHHMPVSESLKGLVTTLMAVEVQVSGRIPFAIAPHDSVMLSVQFGRSADCIEAKGEHGHNTCVTGIRRWRGSFFGAGDCVSLFAMLTPLVPCACWRASRSTACRAFVRAWPSCSTGASRASSNRHSPSPRDSKAGCTRSRSGSTTAPSERREQSTAALRAGRAAMRLCAEPGIEVESLADAEHVSRRQLERDFSHYLGTSPRHLAQVARVQWVSRRARSGASLADIAADVGFSDQAHMSRSIRQMTGLTPRDFVRPRQTPMASAFRAATGGRNGVSVTASRSPEGAIRSSAA
jgi:AraC-like DNA-binding protein